MPDLKLSPKEVTALMRALLRSLENTPESERPAHARIYEKLSAAHVTGLPRKLTRAVGQAIDAVIGR